MEYSICKLENLELENITFRNPRKSSSMCDISNLNNSTSLNASLISLPNRSLEESYTLLNERITKLAIELESANQEIENLNLENRHLRVELDKSKKIISTYKKMGLSGTLDQLAVQSSSRLSQTSQIVKNNIPKDISVHNINKQDLKENRSSKKICEVVEEVTTTPENINNVTVRHKKVNNTSTHNFTAQKDTFIKNKKKIMILADEQGKYVCRYLQKILGDGYFVSSFCKPGANMTTILNSEKNTYRQLKIMMLLLF